MGAAACLLFSVAEVSVYVNAANDVMQNHIHTKELQKVFCKLNFLQRYIRAL